MTLLSKLAQKTSQSVGRKAERSVGQAVAHEVAEKVSKEAANKVGKEVAGKVGKEVAGKAAKQVTAIATKDVIKVASRETAEKVAKEVANPAFDAAMAEVRVQIKKRGAFANMLTPLLRAVETAGTTAEATQITHLALKLSTENNAANKRAILEGARRAIEKSTGHEEGHAALRLAVKARQEGYALFGLPDKNLLIETAVDKFWRLGGSADEEMARKALALVSPGFGQPRKSLTIKRVTLMTVIEDKITAIGNYMKKALR